MTEKYPLIYKSCSKTTEDIAMNTIYKVNDVADCLVVGATYTTRKSGRMVEFKNTKTNTVVHLFPHDVERFCAQGRLVVVDQTQSDAMHCEAVSKLCHVLASHYIY
jgi:hypothetical protein